jgi:hypothetical protein
MVTIHSEFIFTAIITFQKPTEILDKVIPVFNLAPSYENIWRRRGRAPHVVKGKT